MAARHSLNKLAIAEGLIFFSMVFLRMAESQQSVHEAFGSIGLQEKRCIMYGNKTKEVNMIIQ